MDISKLGEQADPDSKTGRSDNWELRIDAFNSWLKKYQQIGYQSFRSNSSVLAKPGQMRVLIKACCSPTGLSEQAAARREEVLQQLILHAEFRGAQEQRVWLKQRMMQHARLAIEALSSRSSFFQAGVESRLKVMVVQMLKELLTKDPPDQRAAARLWKVTWSSELDGVMSILFGRVREQMAAPAFLPAIPTTHPFAEAKASEPGIRVMLPISPSEGDSLLKQIMPDGNIPQVGAYLPAAARQSWPATARIAELAVDLQSAVWSVLQSRHDARRGLWYGCLGCDSGAAALQRADRDGVEWEIRHQLHTMIEQAQKLEAYAKELQDLGLKYMETRGLLQDAVDEYLHTGRPRDFGSQALPDCYHGAAIVVRVCEQLEFVSRMLIALRGESAMSRAYVESSAQLYDWLPAVRDRLQNG